MAVTSLQKVQYVLQIVCTLAVIIGLFLLIPVFAAAVQSSVLLSILAFLAGILLADFLSGIVHWAADTWGKETWPVIGPAILKSFRDHHKFPKKILKNDFFETNGDACMVLVPILAAGIFLRVSGLAAVVLFAFSLSILLTNQSHKYSHMARPPLPVSFLQKAHFVLHESAHASHHRKPFSSTYCITTGWLNAPLNAINFWRNAERFISAVTGAVPRADEKKKAPGGPRRNRRVSRSE